LLFVNVAIVFMASRPFGMQRQILIHLADGLVALASRSIQEEVNAHSLPSNPRIAVQECGKIRGG
jgi:hypothetical protein